MRQIKAIVEKKQRLTINLDELRNEFPELAEFLARKPGRAIPLFEDRLNLIIKNEFLDTSSDKARAQGFPVQTKLFRINVTGNFGK